MTYPVMGTQIKPPFAGPHLPTVADSPATSHRIAQVSAKPLNDVDHPRVAKDLGRGPYRNKFGATCVALVQAKGLIFPDPVGFAKNIPSAAKAAGYVVDGRIDEGAAFITAESSAGGTDTGHTGIILDASDPDWVYVQEQNYKGDHLTEGWVPRASIIAVVHL